MKFKLETVYISDRGRNHWANFSDSSIGSVKVELPDNEEVRAAVKLLKNTAQKQFNEDMGFVPREKLSFWAWFTGK